MDPNFKAIADLFQVPDTSDAALIRAQKRKKKGDTPDESDELGAQSLMDGDYEAAIRHFREAVAKRDPTDIRSRINLAAAYDATDQLPQAYRQYETALRLQQEAAEPLVGMSDLLKRYGRFREAVMDLQKAIEREPGNAFYHLKLAETLRDMGERKGALLAIQSAIVAKADDAFLHYWMGDLLIELRDFNAALDSLRAAIELSPGDDYLYLRATVAFWRVGKRQEALKALRLASDLDPSKNVYHGLLEIILQKMNLMEEAALEEERASRMDRYDLDALRRLLLEMELEVDASTSST